MKIILYKFITFIHFSNTAVVDNFDNKNTSLIFSVLLGMFLGLYKFGFSYIVFSLVKDDILH